VQVTNGLFSVDLDVTHGHFNGQGLWLEVEVGGTRIGCQEILPVPYALSLRPGAVISDTTSYVQLNLYYVKDLTSLNYGVYAKATYGFAVFNYGIYGYGTTTGVYGSSDSGTGVVGRSESGTAIHATGTGIIKSTADTEIAVSPLKMVAYYGSNVDLRPSGIGWIEVRPNATGSQYVYVPVDLPSVLFGTRTKLKSARICYKCDNATSYITRTYVRYATDSYYTTLISDDTNRMNTDWECYTLTDTTPEEIEGSLWIHLTLDFAGTGDSHDIRIGKITLTLTEQ
jgi:hypothetical protein